jgi:stress response protein SCP2
MTPALIETVPATFKTSELQAFTAKQAAELKAFHQQQATERARFELTRQIEFTATVSALIESEKAKIITRYREEESAGGPPFCITETIIRSVIE